MTANRVDEAPRYATVRDYLQVVRKHKVMILVITLIFGVAVYLRDHGATRTYEASASIQFFDQTLNLGQFGAVLPQDISPDQRAAIHAQNIHTLPVAQRAARSLHLPAREAAGLLGSVSTAPQAVTDLVVVTAASSSPSGAARLANAFANAATAQTAADLKAQYGREAAAVQRQIAGLANLPSTAYFRALLNNQLQQLRQGPTAVTPARVAQSATAPASASSPQTKRDVVLGLITGLVVALLIAFIRDALDRRYANAQAIARELGLPILGLVRSEALGRMPRAAGAQRVLDDVDLESIRILRSKLGLIDVDRPVRTILVSSAVAEEGKSTVAAALAAAFAQTGRTTLLLECDLRAPSLAKRLGLQASPGLTDCLTSTVDPRQPVWLSGGRAVSGSNGHGVARPGGLDVSPSPNGNGAAGGAGRFDCIVAGTPSPRPAELLGSQQLKTLLTHLQGVYDVIVIDSAPLLPVADTLELLPDIDCVAMCLRVSKTSREHARAAGAVLAELCTRPVGLVLTGLRSRDGYDAQASYAYSGEWSGSATRLLPRIGSRARSS